MIVTGDLESELDPRSYFMGGLGGLNMFLLCFSSILGQVFAPLGGRMDSFV